MKNSKNKFWLDDLGRRHAKLYYNENEDGTIGLFHIPRTHCSECEKEMIPYKKEYAAYSPTDGAFLHFSYENNYCEDCAKEEQKLLANLCNKLNVWAPSVTIGGWQKKGWHETTYIQSPGEEVSPEYDIECEKIEVDPALPVNN